VRADGRSLFVFRLHFFKDGPCEKAGHVKPCLGIFPLVFFALVIPDNVLEERKQDVRNLLESEPISSRLQQDPQIDTTCMFNHKWIELLFEITTGSESGKSAISESAHFISRFYSPQTEQRNVSPKRNIQVSLFYNFTHRWLVQAAAEGGKRQGP
jgi:hypothetical protein